MAPIDLNLYCGLRPYIFISYARQKLGLSCFLTGTGKGCSCSF